MKFDKGTRIIITVEPSKDYGMHVEYLSSDVSKPRLWDECYKSEQEYLIKRLALYIEAILIFIMIGGVVIYCVNEGIIK